LGFALGLNLSVSRIGSVINAAMIPSIYDSNGLGAALFCGFVFTIFSLLCAIGMSMLDKKADTKLAEGQLFLTTKRIFHWSDLTSFGTTFWLLTFSCVFTYMSIFTYIQNASDLI
jgi:hypothetical protein